MCDTKFYRFHYDILLNVNMGHSLLNRRGKMKFKQNKEKRRINTASSFQISVGIALGYGLDDRGSRIRFPAGAGNFLFTTASRTALGPTQPPIQFVPGALSLEVKRPGREADRTPPSSAEVKE
jgi:hypothetical protein